MQVHHVFQQTGFRRVKRGYRPLTQDDDDVTMGRVVSGPQAMQKKDSWSQLRASLDMDNINPAVVHPEDHFQKLQMAAEDKQKRGYNPLKVIFNTTFLLSFCYPDLERLCQRLSCASKLALRIAPKPYSQITN